MIINHATHQDAPDIESLLFVAWMSTYPNEAYGITQDDIAMRFVHRADPALIRKRAERFMQQDPLEPWMVARIDGKVRGVCNLVLKQDRNQLQRIYVDPQYHNRGIGSALWQEARARIDRHKDTYVDVVCYNEQAIRFYRKHGFTPTGRIWFEDRIVFQSGAKFPEMEMVLKAAH